MMRFPSFPALVIGGVIGAATMLSSGTADAGRIRFGGSGHVSGRVHIGGGGSTVRVHRGGRAHFSGRWHGRGSIRFARPAWRPRVWVGGNVWVGSGYYYPRSYYYYPEYVPSYYGGAYYPVQPASSAPGIVAVAPAQPSLPVFGIGVFAGGSSVQETQVSSDVGAMLRFRLTPGLLIEGEIGKTSFEDDVRVDRRIGASLIYEIGARNTFAPYLLAGGGVQQAEVGGDFSTTQNFGEIGVGLRFALSRNLHLTFDVRAGRNQTIDSDQPVRVSGSARTVAPPSGQFGDDDTEDYTRGRLAAILYF
ncbi:MAG: hypothetical protein H7138_07155 [Myxococcales bacterium]|nr:hypothetical protein [Myxococcales bacterium]